MIAGLDERLLREVVSVAALDAFRFAGVEGAVVVHLQRVVGEIDGRGAARGERQRGADDRGGREDPAAAVGHVLVDVPSRTHYRTSR